MEAMSRNLSRELAANLADKHQLDQVKQAEMAYGIEIVALNIANAILTLTLGWVMGVFWGTLTCLLTIAAFRHNAGGGHSESPWRCAAVTMVVFPLLALAAKQISIWQPLYLNILSVLSISLGFALIIIYAPVDSPKAPIVSPLRRKRLKIWAISIMTIIAAIVIFLRFSSLNQASEISMCLTLSLLWVSFNLTPWGHRLWTFIDIASIR
jgi:accessory gene regulator B